VIGLQPTLAIPGNTKSAVPENNKMIRIRVSHKSIFLMGSLVVLWVSLAPTVSAITSEGARVVTYSRDEIIPVKAKLRFSTLIVLPDNEEILDFTTGDKEFWIVNGARNLCYIHPAQAGIRTNLNLITASGNVYSFLLTEISNEPNARPDLKLFVQPKEESRPVRLTGYVRAGEVEAYRREMERARVQSEAEIQAARAQASEEVNRFRSDYAAKLHFDFMFDKKAAAEPFLVLAIYHDDRFTYIRCDAREKPALYELRDGKPNLTNFQVEQGVYIVPKILDHAYLAVGKKKFTFTRRTAAN
jgi:type IV secretory pathway VirB9-like protein